LRFHRHNPSREKFPLLTLRHSDEIEFPFLFCGTLRLMLRMCQRTCDVAPLGESRFRLAKTCAVTSLYACCKTVQIRLAWHAANANHNLCEGDERVGEWCKSWIRGRLMGRSRNECSVLGTVAIKHGFDLRFMTGAFYHNYLCRCNPGFRVVPML
jgi:hypothetical protein